LRLSLLASACLIAPGIRAWQAWGNTDKLVLISASALLFLLVVARMVGLVRQEERAAARELALQQAGVDLVAAAGPERVNEAAISAVRALTGNPVAVRLLLLSGEGAFVVASSDEDGDWAVSKEAHRWLRESATTALQ